MRRPLKKTEEYLTGILAGDRVVLGQAITLVESTHPAHRQVADEVIAQLLLRKPETESMRIGITGSPGVGKSTFIEALGMYLTNQGKKTAVLAIDPSSQVSKGSIMGDKTRMDQLSASNMAFIRPSPSGDSLGGVARKTRETIILVEAAGYDTVLIETVGVGQSETAVHSMTDVFLLLLLPGAGDELQGIKRGIVEMADILVVNKADGERIALANQAKAHYINATHLLPLGASGWSPKVLTCSALDQNGIPAVWNTVQEYRKKVVENGFFQQNRAKQAKYWMRESLTEGLNQLFYGNPIVAERLRMLENEVVAGRVSPFAAAQEALRLFAPLPS